MWGKKGIWAKLFQFCSLDPDLEYIMIDAKIIQAHTSAAGYGKQKKLLGEA